MSDYRVQAPPILREFLSYHEIIKAHSKGTVDEYFLDLRNFFRYLKKSRNPELYKGGMEEIDIADVDLDFVSAVTMRELYDYMLYLSRDRARHQNSVKTEYGLSAASRARKLMAIRSFYHYLTAKTHQLEENPIRDVDTPKRKKSLPEYLTAEESIRLLESVEGKYQERDYCILTLFLNCGLRISELIALNLSDIQGDTLRVLGKGNKTRILYLNEACQDALAAYLTAEESIRLLESVEGKYQERDYCILTLFLNCGLRISELIALNLSDIQGDALRVLGKGNKTRILYLNEACQDALAAYLSTRHPVSGKNADALFLSARDARPSRSAIHAMVKRCLSAAGLDSSRYSAHKLRHTAATLMIQSGANLRTVQEVLGHEHLNTTEIYTHVDNEALRAAAKATPLSQIKRKEK